MGERDVLAVEGELLGDERRRRGVSAEASAWTDGCESVSGTERFFPLHAKDRSSTPGFRRPALSAWTPPFSSTLTGGRTSIVAPRDFHRGLVE